MSTIRRKPKDSAAKELPVPQGTPPTPEDHRERRRRVQKLHARLAQEEVAFARWMKRLKRAFGAVVKQDRSITRIKRQLTQLEGKP
jgi:hypothetical protein